MEKIRIAVIGYGNIGRFAAEAVNSADDMELAGIVRRKPDQDEIHGVPVMDSVEKLGKVDAALLCVPSRSVESEALKYLALGVNTVDSYDVHSSIYDLRCTLDAAAKKSGAVSVVSAGWDPGSDSVVRALLECCAPCGITYTNFGPGMSMGHTVAVKAMDGVENALSVTIPAGTGVHRRMVYVQLASGASIEDVTRSIKSDPYFAYDETHVLQVDNVDAYIDKGHGVNLVRKGVSGQTDNQLFEFNMKINNPALTSQVMVSCARAASRQKPGAYTMIELPVADLLPLDRESAIRKLV